MDTGVLYGVGVGPGDPELLTVKAIRTMRACEVIALPGESPTETTAYRIAVQAVPELAGKRLLALSFPMTKEEGRLALCHRRAADEIERCLADGRDVSFLTMGDPTVYSTYLYVHRLVKSDGFETRIVNGIPSFCAAAAALGVGLAEGEQELHVLPASRPVGSSLHLPGTKVLMKAGSRLFAVTEQLGEEDLQVMMVENCGMEQEKKYDRIEDIPEQAGYYSLLIAKEKET